MLLNPPQTLKSVVEHILYEKRDIFDVRDEEDLIVLNDKNLQLYSTITDNFKQDEETLWL